MRVGLAHHVDQFLADLLRELREVALGQRLQVGGRVDFVEQTDARFGDGRRLDGRRVQKRLTSLMILGRDDRGTPGHPTHREQAWFPWTTSAAGPRAALPRGRRVFGHLRLWPAGVAGDDFDALLGHAQAFGTHADEPGAFLVGTDEFLQRQPGIFHLLDDALRAAPSRSRRSAAARPGRGLTRRQRVHGQRAWDR